MDRFPAKPELIGFFECEPEVLDPGTAWLYNHLTFITARGQDKVQCVIEPASMILRMWWWRGDPELVSLDANCVNGLEIETEDGREILIASFSEEHQLFPLRIQLKPSVHVFGALVISRDETQDSGLSHRGAVFLNAAYSAV